MNEDDAAPEGEVAGGWGEIYSWRTGLFEKITADICISMIASRH